MRTSVPYPARELYVARRDGLHVTCRHIGVKHVRCRPQHPDREEEDAEEEQPERQEVAALYGVAVDATDTVTLCGDGRQRARWSHATGEAAVHEVSVCGMLTCLEK